MKNMQSLKIFVLVMISSIGYQSTLLLAQKTWNSITISADWQPRFQHSSVVFKNMMWILGGDNNGEQLNDVWYLN